MIRQQQRIRFARSNLRFGIDLVAGLSMLSLAGSRYLATNVPEVGLVWLLAAINLFACAVWDRLVPVVDILDDAMVIHRRPLRASLPCVYRESALSRWRGRS